MLLAASFSLHQELYEAWAQTFFFFLHKEIEGQRGKEMWLS